MPNHFKVHELIADAAELAELEEFARQPGRTIDEVHEWLAARGYTMGRGSVGRWMASFREQLLRERFSRSSELAKAITGAVKGGEFSEVADAAAMQLTQVVFEQAARLESDGQIDPLDVQRMTRSLANLTATKERLIEMLAQKFDAQASKLATKRQITQEDLDEVRKAVFG